MTKHKPEGRRHCDGRVKQDKEGNEKIEDAEFAVDEEHCESCDQKSACDGQGPAHFEQLFVRRFRPEHTLIDIAG